jgi:hypothetical protein
VSARAAPATAEDAANASAAHASRLVIGAVEVASSTPSSAARRRASPSPPTREGDARARRSRLREGPGARTRAVHATVAIAERAPLGVMNETRSGWIKKTKALERRVRIAQKFRTRFRFRDVDYNPHLVPSVDQHTRAPPKLRPLGRT